MVDWTTKYLEMKLKYINAKGNYLGPSNIGGANGKGSGKGKGKGKGKGNAPEIVSIEMDRKTRTYLNNKDIIKKFQNMNIRYRFQTLNDKHYYTVYQNKVANINSIMQKDLQLNIIGIKNDKVYQELTKNWPAKINDLQRVWGVNFTLIEPTSQYPNGALQVFAYVKDKVTQMLDELTNKLNKKTIRQTISPKLTQILSNNNYDLIRKLQAKGLPQISLDVSSNTITVEESLRGQLLSELEKIQNPDPIVEHNIPTKLTQILSNNNYQLINKLRKDIPGIRLDISSNKITVRKSLLDQLKFELKKIKIPGNKPNSKGYYGLVFNNKGDKNWLIQKQTECGEDWNTPNDVLHMTICYPANKSELENSLNWVLGDEYNVLVEAIGVSDKACALRLTLPGDSKSNSTFPHITLKIAKNAQAKDSNDIVDFKYLVEPKILTGKVVLLGTAQNEQVKKVASDELKKTKFKKNSSGKTKFKKSSSGNIILESADDL